LIDAIVLNRDRADDLTQDAFVRVYRHLSDYSPGGKFVPWLKRIAINLARNALRDALGEEARQQAIAAAVEPLDHAVHRSLDPAVILASGFLQQDVRAVLDKLSPEHREVLLLYYITGLSLQETAVRTGCAEGTVKSRLFHARRKMREFSETLSIDINEQHE
jgi:RNA polymerase sigma-70 factor (ECF subfamily)